VDIAACLDTAIEELVDDLREYGGDTRLKHGYYDRIVRTAAFELKDRWVDSIPGVTYNRAVQAVQGLRLMLAQQGIKSKNIPIYMGPIGSFVGSMEVLEWPPVE